VCPGSMHHKRRSGRIAKELDILLFGTDTAGKVFSEHTITVVLSRHGAGIVSRHRFASEEILTLRLPGSDQEAEVRLVGQIGGEPGRYVYGVAFVDPELHFWPIEFPPPDRFEATGSSTALQCSICQSRQEIEQGEIEQDVYSVNGSILRYCDSCGTSTPWKKAEGEAPSAAAAQRQVAHPSSPRPAKPDFSIPPASSATSTTRPALGSPAPSLLASLQPTLTEQSSPVLSPQSSSYSGQSVLSEFASLAELPSSPAAASATAVLQAPEPANALHAARFEAPLAPLEAAPVRLLDATGRPVNRRRHMRIRVNFSACVRHSKHPDEVVECENVSKGGLCFHSLQQYDLNSLVEVAAPFSPGEAALFVPAQVKRIEALSGGQVFRYGVEYVKPSVPA
jgi:hypothetical protein